jgi:ABC-type transport system substrate-binding protein
MKRPFRRLSTTQARRRPPVQRALCLGMLIALFCSLTPGRATAAPPAGGLSTGWQVAETTHFRVHVLSGDATAAATFAVMYGGAVETAFSELSLLFSIDPPDERIPIYVYPDNSSLESAINTIDRPEIPGVTAFADPANLDISLSLANFEKLSPVESENQLRHAISHVMTGIATNGTIPWGFDEGFAQYVERPVNEKLARTASLVQTSNQRGALPSWFDMNRPNAFSDPGLAAAQSYAVIAFLIDRYEIAPLRQFLVELRTAPSWNEAMRAAYGRDPNDIEKQWEEDLPRWTSGNWRNNLVAAFDLEQAKALFDKANYAAAKAALDPSQTLFRQINAPDKLELVRQMIAQCDIGIQAESLMTQTQQALEAHTYDRAINLLAQAKLQFAQLPANQQPTDLIATYERLANDGLTATRRLDEATQLQSSWRDFPKARAAAREAGTIFAALGDEARVSQSEKVLDHVDKTQRQIVLSLTGLAVLALIWLGLWLWARGPSELNWG